jgi:hypothetical protein
MDRQGGVTIKSKLRAKTVIIRSKRTTDYTQWDERIIAPVVYTKYSVSSREVQELRRERGLENTVTKGREELRKIHRIIICTPHQKRLGYSNQDEMGVACRMRKSDAKCILELQPEILKERNNL